MTPADEQREAKREANRRWKEKNPEANREANRRWKEKNPEAIRKANLDWCEKNQEARRETNRNAMRRWREKYPGRQTYQRYRITPEEFQALLEAQEHHCAICGSVNRAQDGGKLRQLNVDHDHTTGLIRGLLCHHCNLGIGHLNDDSELLRKAIAYLEKDR